MRTKLEEAFAMWIKVQRTSELHRKDCEDEYEQVFIAGAEFMQKDLLESASEGFEEWFDSLNIYCGDDFEYMKYTLGQGWQACELKSQKILQEKDEKIAELESKFKAERNDVLYMDKRRDEFKDKYDQAIKDLQVFIRETLSGAGHTYLETTGNRLKLKHGISEE